MNGSIETKLHYKDHLIPIYRTDLFELLGSTFSIFWTLGEVTPKCFHEENIDFKMAFGAKPFDVWMISHNGFSLKIRLEDHWKLP